MFSQTPTYRVGTPENQVIVFGLMADIVVPDPSDTVFVVPLGALYRLDLISQNAYGVPDLWWVLARVNGILDPLVGPALGQELRIPSKSRLAQLGILAV